LATVKTLGDNSQPENIDDKKSGHRQRIQL